ncbi:MAG: hypothetical protein ACLUB2_05305 [Butyricicoccus pullicaecorum]
MLGQAMNGERAAAPAATGKTLQAFFMSALCAQRVLLAAASALNESFVETRAKPRVSIGDFARCDGDSGLCPENPQPFEKGWRKLQLGVRWSTKVEYNRWEIQCFT